MSSTTIGAVCAMVGAVGGATISTVVGPYVQYVLSKPASDNCSVSASLLSETQQRIDRIYNAVRNQTGISEQNRQDLQGWLADAESFSRNVMSECR